MVATPARAYRACFQQRLLRPACPRQVPAGLSGGRALLPGPPYERFELIHGVESTNPRDNKPPRFVHVVLAAGKLIDNAHPIPNPPFGPSYGAFGFRWPTRLSPPKKLRDQLLQEPSHSALAVANVDWGAHRGDLVLAPGSHGGGGAWANHLIFLWHHGNVEYAVSLHSWTPIEETVATLREMVDSLSK
jgi:hypothetical protein